MIYLDNSVAARPSERAVQAMLPYHTEDWGVPTVPHDRGERLLPEMKKLYEKVYRFLGADAEDHFILTSSGAEGVNHAVFSTYHDISLHSGKNHFITSSVDEAPAIMAINRLEQHGCAMSLVDVDKDQVVTADRLADHMTPRTALVSLSWGNGLTGLLNPVDEISDLCKERGIVFHLDATHVLGKHYFDLEDAGCDILTFDASPFHAPQGIGGIWSKKGKKLSPFLVGGNEQAGLRAGTFSVASLAALAQAAQEAEESGDLLAMEGARLRDKLESGLVDAVPLFQGKNRLPHISVVAFPGISNEAMLYALNRNKVHASIGGGHFQSLPILLEAMGIETRLAESAVSFSLSRETTEEEIDRAVEIINTTAKSLRSISKELV